MKRLTQDRDGRWVLEEALISWTDEREGGGREREAPCRFVSLCPFLGELV